MVNGKKKGKNGELEWCRFCREHGFPNVRRTAQFCGNTGEAADCIGIDGIHQEVKRVERLNIHEAMEQAERDAEAAGNGDWPVVAHRRNNTEWLVTMRAADWLRMCRMAQNSVRTDMGERWHD